jgi:O-methyltransferase
MTTGLERRRFPGYAHALGRFLMEGDIRGAWRFLRDRRLPLSLGSRLRLLGRFLRITKSVSSPHTQSEMLAFYTEMMLTPPTVEGVFVEAGCFKGGSTAKFSLAAAAMGRRLVVFDSFEGIPENEEKHGRTLSGRSAPFERGDYAGSLDEVRASVTKYGEVEVCSFVKGWFDDTAPLFEEKIAGVYLDVDLESSTRTCLKYFYPLLQVGGALYSQDGHLALVVDLFDDDAFWREEVGCEKPHVEGLRERKLLRIQKTQPCAGAGR